jgi:multiple antibiotic resistance protein
MVLFAVVDIVGSIPLILKLKEQTDEIHPLRTSLFFSLKFLSKL